MSDYDGPEGWASGDDFDCIWCDEWCVTIDGRGLEHALWEWGKHLDTCLGRIDVTHSGGAL